jgi:hypothetical protein
MGFIAELLQARVEELTSTLTVLFNKMTVEKRRVSKGVE